LTLAFEKSRITDMKKYLPPLIVLVLIAGGFWYWRNYKPSQTDNNQNNSDLVLFYGDGCPHCAKVDEFIKQNNIEQKIKFSKKEIFNNKDNAKLLMEKATSCGLAQASVGVPFLWDGVNSKCFMGDVDVINFFQEKSK
jgi:glutaredoxin